MFLKQKPVLCAMIYNVVLIPAVQQSDSVIHIYIHSVSILLLYLLFLFLCHGNGGAQKWQVAAEF